MPRRGKYNARAAHVDGLRFDSQAEARRYAELKLLEAAGVIAGLQIHPRYELQAAFVDGDGRRRAAIVYEADFAYSEDGAGIVEDVKGARTAAWRLKEKLFLARYPALALRVIPAR